MAPGVSDAQNGAYSAANGAAEEGFEPVQQEPIAVIGFSFKYPQEATTVESFWKMLVDGRCASTDIPADRMNVDGWYHPDPYRHDSVSVVE
jgi:acyl transferase domain-containing protein